MSSETYCPKVPYLWPLYVLVVCAVSALCFHSVLDLGLYTHDVDTFYDNQAISEHFGYFFSLDKKQPSGRPLAELVKWIAYAIGGNEPAWFHLVVVGWHTLASLLLARLALRLGCSPALSLGGGLLFLVNLTHFQAVHHISALDYPLAASWALGALLCLAHYRAAPRRRWLLGFYLALILGLMSHMSVVAVVLVALYWHRAQTPNWRAAGRPFLPLILLLPPALFLLLEFTGRHTSTWRTLEQYSFAGLPGRLLERGEILLWFLSRLFTSAHWLPLPLYKMQTWELGAGAAVLAGLIVLLWKKSFPGDLWALWVLGSLLPFLLLPRSAFRPLLFTPSRYLYLATAGSSMLLAWLLQRLAIRTAAWLGRPRWPPLFAGLVGLVLLCSYFSLHRIEALSLYASGRYHIAADERAAGIAQLQRAIARAPGVIPLQEAFYTLFNMLLLEGREVEATQQQAQALLPGNPVVRALGAVLATQDTAAARRAWGERQLSALREELASGDAEIDYDKMTASFYSNLASLFIHKGENARAVEALQQALELDPGRLADREKLAFAYFYSARYEEAAYIALSAARSPAGDRAVFYEVGAAALHNAGRRKQAITICRRGLERHPTARLYFLLGRFYCDERRYQEALQAFGRALALGPEPGDLWRTYGAMADAHSALGRAEEAARARRKAERLRP